ncbi:DUF485 domain-containing protein [Paraburkholderia sp. IMGN_8]|uniref:DUF485 domain-containing protein n=1 Tax=Paraburkholderia sp. IMGN_8 TaxID=3136564 RepID=UPI003101A0FC
MRSVKKNRISAVFAAVIVILFSAFIGMFTFGRDVFAEPVVPGVPWSAVVEPLLIVVALLISVAYSLVIGRVERSTGEV